VGLVTGSISGSTHVDIRIKPVNQSRLASISESNPSISESTHLDIRIKRVDQNRLASKIRIKPVDIRRFALRRKKLILKSVDPDFEPLRF